MPTTEADLSPDGTTARSLDLAVVGGGMAGMLAALLLARRGHTVTVYERDSTELPPSADEAFTGWQRRGAPHVRQSHALLARLRSILRVHVPDVLDALYEQGATELSIDRLMPPTIEDRSPQPGDDELALLCCRRLTIEWVLRRAVTVEPGVTWRGGVAVSGLLAEGIDVCGLRFDDGSSVRHDLVVVADGRNSRVMTWIAELGGPVQPQEEASECGILYLSRFYRLREGQEMPLLTERGAGGDLGYLGFAGFYGDNRSFSITLGLPVADRPLLGLKDNDTWERVIRTLTPLDPWTADGLADPITDVEVMARLRNRVRRFVVDGAPVATGLAVIGDAAIATNPWYGKGCSTAGIAAAGLADLLDVQGDDRHALALGLHEVMVAEIEPHYAQACRQDADRMKVQAATFHDGEPDPAAQGIRDFILHGLLPATRVDPVAYRAFFRSFNMLDLPNALLENAQVMAAAQQAHAEKDQRPEPPALGPTRDEMLALIAG